MNGAAAMNRDTLKHVKIMYELYMEKYETACMYREHEKAIRYAGFYGALEQLLLGAKEHEFVQ